MYLSVIFKLLFQPQHCYSYYYNNIIIIIINIFNARSVVITIKTSNESEVRRRVHQLENVIESESNIKCL